MQLEKQYQNKLLPSDLNPKTMTFAEKVLGCGEAQYENRFTNTKKYVPPMLRKLYEKECIFPLSDLSKNSSAEAEGLPCYLKLRRSFFETNNQVEARFDLDNETQIWVRPIDYPYAKLENVLQAAELEPIEDIPRGHPVLVITEQKARRRALVINCEDPFVKYLDVDDGYIDEVRVDRVFRACPDLLSFPNAAMRCKLKIEENALYERGKNRLLSWTRSRIQIRKWGRTPTVYLSIFESEFPKPQKDVPQSIELRKKQKLYRGLPAIIVPAAFTLLKNCSISHVEPYFAYIAMNSTMFETETETGKALVNPRASEAFQKYTEGDLASIRLNEIAWRVQIREIEGMQVIVQCVDNGTMNSVDLGHLQPLLERHAPLAMKVRLPEDYFGVLPFNELSILLRTGVFDALVLDGDGIPCVRLFTTKGIEVRLVFQ